MAGNKRFSCLALLALAWGCDSKAPRPAPTSLDRDQGTQESERAKPIVPVSVADASVAESADAASASDAGPLVGIGDSGLDAAAIDPEPEKEASVAQPAVCGDGVRAGSEQCDGTDLDSQSCAGLGFELGQLSCREDCVFDTSACEGDEHCFDGVDNDGDGLVDCDDGRCVQACSNPCSFALNLTDLWVVDFDGVGVVSSNTTGHGGRLMSACTDAADGGEIVYRFVAEQDGVMSVSLAAEQLMSVSVNTACDWPEQRQVTPDGSALGCVSVDRELKVPIQEAEELFIIVDGRSAEQDGAFTLTVHPRAVVCGDGYLDPGEECDDHNRADFDGCDSECRIETSEIEPNEEPGIASPFAVPYYAQIAPAGDVDYVQITLNQETDAFVLQTLALGSVPCSERQMDPVLRMYDDAGNLMGENDDGGEGYCARLRMLGLAKGTYTIAISAAEGSSFDQFPYRLELATSTCGDGVRGIEEECDDGNLLPDDGCSPTCRLP